MYHELTMFTHDPEATFKGTFVPCSRPAGTHCIHLDTRFNKVPWEETDIRLFLETKNIAPMLAALDNICAAMRLYLYGNTVPTAGLQEEWNNV